MPIRMLHTACGASHKSGLIRPTGCDTASILPGEGSCLSTFEIEMTRRGFVGQHPDRHASTIRRITCFAFPHFWHVQPSQ